MTCSDMFALHITMADGTPGVRMYEYERIRGTAYTDGMRIIAPADKTFVNYADDNHYYLDFADLHQMVEQEYPLGELDFRMH